MKVPKRVVGVSLSPKALETLSAGEPLRVGVLEEVDLLIYADKYQEEIIWATVLDARRVSEKAGSEEVQEGVTIEQKPIEEEKTS